MTTGPGPDVLHDPSPHEEQVGASAGALAPQGIQVFMARLD
jgi:hypothetical protein